MSQDDLPPNLQQEIQRQRKFSLSEAIGRAGSSFLKGSQDMVPRPLRALAVINEFIEQYLNDPDGALKICLKRWVKTDVRLGKYLDQPLEALHRILLDMMQQPQILYEFARQVAIEWGHMNGERPHFQKPGVEPHPEMVYTHQLIRDTLTKLLSYSVGHIG